MKRRNTRRSSNSPHLNGSGRSPHSSKDISRRRGVEKDDRYASPSPVKQQANINTRNSTIEGMKKSEFSKGGSSYSPSRNNCNESDVLSARRQRFAPDKRQPEQRSIDILDAIMDKDPLLQTDLDEPTTDRQRRESSMEVDVHQTTTLPKRIVKLRNPDVSNSSTPNMTSKKVHSEYYKYMIRIFLIDDI